MPEQLAASFAPFWRHFAVRSFQIVLDWKTPVTLPSYKGSTIRGAVGFALRALVCTEGSHEPCVLCRHRQSCPYAILYESAVYPGERPSNLNDIPKPFVLIPPLSDQRDFVPGHTTTVIVVLVGGAVHLLPALVTAFALVGEKGIREDNQGLFVVRRVVQLQPHDAPTLVWEDIHDPLAFFQSTSSDGLELLPVEPLSDIPSTLAGATALDLTFVTPLRIEERGSLATNAPPFATLIARLCERVDLLSRFYCGVALPDPTLLLERARYVATLDTTLAWYDWTRVSVRSGRQQFGGLLGSVVYGGADLTPFICFLHAGALLGIGKGTSMGMGRFTIALG